MILSSLFFKNYIFPQMNTTDSYTFIYPKILTITIFRSLYYVQLLFWFLLTTRSLSETSILFLYLELIHYSSFQHLPLVQYQYKDNKIQTFDLSFVISFLSFLNIYLIQGIYKYIIGLTLCEFILYHKNYFIHLYQYLFPQPKTEDQKIDEKKIFERVYIFPLFLTIFFFL